MNVDVAASAVDVTSGYDRASPIRAAAVNRDVTTATGDRSAIDERAGGINAAADEGKTEEQLRKESDEAVQEVIDRDKHAETILEMAEQIKKEGGKDER